MLQNSTSFLLFSTCICMYIVYVDTVILLVNLFHNTCLWEVITSANEVNDRHCLFVH